MNLKNSFRAQLLLLLLLSYLWHPACADSQTWSVSRSLKVTGRVTSVAFSPSQSVVAVGVQPDFRRKNFNWIELRCGDNCKLIRRIKTDTRVFTLRFSPDGTMVASGQDAMTTRLWEVRTGKLLRTLKGADSTEVQSIGFSSRATMLASAGFETQIYLWNWKTGKLLRKIGHDMDFTRALAFSKNGRTLASATSGDNAIKFWDVHTGRLKRVLQHSTRTFSVTYSHDFALIASSDDRGNVKVWDSQTGKLLHSFSIGKPKLRENLVGSVPIAFSADDKVIASGGLDYAIHLWQVKSGKPMLSLSGHRGTVTALAFSSSGNKLLSASRDGTVKTWWR